MRAAATAAGDAPAPAAKKSEHEPAGSSAEESQPLIIHAGSPLQWACSQSMPFDVTYETLVRLLGAECVLIWLCWRQCTSGKVLTTAAAG